MKRKRVYFCKGCGSEIAIFGNLGKKAIVGCNICKIEMYEENNKKMHSRAVSVKKKSIREKKDG